MSSFRSITTILEAGEGVTFSVIGKFYRILSATGSVSIGIDDDQPEPLSVGLGIHEPIEFNRIRIQNTSGAQNTIIFGVGIGAIDDTRFNLDTGASINVADGGGSLTVDGVVSVSNMTFPDGLTEITRHGYGQIGASFVSGNSLSVVQTVVAPAININGIVLRTISCIPYGADFALQADTAAPASWNDTSKRAVFRANGGAFPVMLRDLFIPAGNGIYLTSSAPGAFYCLTFDIL